MHLFIFKFKFPLLHFLETGYYNPGTNYIFVKITDKREDWREKLGEARGSIWTKAPY